MIRILSQPGSSRCERAVRPIRPQITYEQLLHRAAVLKRFGYKLCPPMPGWDGWSDWHLIHQKTLRLRPAPPPARLEKILRRLEQRAKARGWM